MLDQRLLCIQSAGNLEGGSHGGRPIGVRFPLFQHSPFGEGFTVRPSCVEIVGLGPNGPSLVSVAQHAQPAMSISSTGGYRPTGHNLVQVGRAPGLPKSVQVQF